MCHTVYINNIIIASLCPVNTRYFNRPQPQKRERKEKRFELKWGFPENNTQSPIGSELSGFKLVNA